MTYLSKPGLDGPNLYRPGSRPLGALSLCHRSHPRRPAVLREPLRPGATSSKSVVCTANTAGGAPGRAEATAPRRGTAARIVLTLARGPRRSQSSTIAGHADITGSPVRSSPGFSPQQRLLVATGPCSSIGAGTQPLHVQCLREPRTRFSKCRGGLHQFSNSHIVWRNFWRIDDRGEDGGLHHPPRPRETRCQQIHGEADLCSVHRRNARISSACSTRSHLAPLPRRQRPCRRHLSGGGAARLARGRFGARRTTTGRQPQRPLQCLCRTLGAHSLHCHRTGRRWDPLHSRQQTSDGPLRPWLRTLRIHVGGALDRGSAPSVHERAVRIEHPGATFCCPAAAAAPTATATATATTASSASSAAASEGQGAQAAAAAAAAAAVAITVARGHGGALGARAMAVRLAMHLTALRLRRHRLLDRCPDRLPPRACRCCRAYRPERAHAAAARRRSEPLTR